MTQRKMWNFYTNDRLLKKYASVGEGDEVLLFMFCYFFLYNCIDNNLHLAMQNIKDLPINMCTHRRRMKISHISVET